MTIDVDGEIWQLLDEDCYGLWEIVWRLSAVLDIEPAAAVQLAMDGVRRLSRGVPLQVFVQVDWGEDGFRRLHSPEDASTLADPHSWLPPAAGRPGVWVCKPPATPSNTQA